MTDAMEQSTSDLVEIAQGDYIFREGDLGTEMYVIHQGRVEILKRIEGGETQLAVFEQGDFFGEQSLLDEEPRSASVRALEDSVLVRIDGATFIQMITETPEIAVRMMRKLSVRLRVTGQRLQQALGHLPPEQESAVPAVPEAESPATYRLIDRQNGVVFDLSAGPDNTVGRADPVTGINPEIDLTKIDTDRSSSRRHAKIYHRDGRFYVAEEIGTMNGTFVNGKRIETGRPVEFRPGDVLRFGVLEFDFTKV